MKILETTCEDCEVDGTGFLLYPVAGFGIRCIESLGPTITLSLI
jgi:hypothetical protein